MWHELSLLPDIHLALVARAWKGRVDDLCLELFGDL